MMVVSKKRNLYNSGWHRNSIDLCGSTGIDGMHAVKLRISAILVMS